MSSMVFDPEKQAAAFLAAINSGKPEQVLALVGASPTWSEPVSGRVEGKEALAKLVGEMLGLARWNYQATTVVRDDQRALVLYRASAVSKTDASKHLVWEGSMYLAFDPAGKLREGIEAYDGPRVARGLGIG